jgi:hypothetical protein
MTGYIRRVRAAWRAERIAQAALDFDYQDRMEYDGPWGEDDTYLRLNANAADASATLLHTVLRRIVDVAPRRGVGDTLRDVTATERGADLAEQWAERHAARRAVS